MPEPKNKDDDKKEPKEKDRRFSDKFSADNDRDLPEYKTPKPDDK